MENKKLYIGLGLFIIIGIIVFFSVQQSVAGYTCNFNWQISSYNINKVFVFYEVKYINITDISSSKNEKMFKKKEIRKEIRKERKEVPRKERQETRKETRKKKSSIVTDSTENKKFYYDEDGYVTNSSASKVKKINHPKDKNSFLLDEPIDKWTSNNFLIYLNKKFNETYGYESIEFGTIGGKKYLSSAKGILYLNIKRKLINVFADLGLGNDGLKKYIDWTYDIKSDNVKFPITLNLLVHKGMITEWMQLNVKKKTAVRKIINKKIHKPKK